MLENELTLNEMICSQSRHQLEWDQSTVCVTINHSYVLLVCQIPVRITVTFIELVRA